MSTGSLLLTVLVSRSDSLDFGSEPFLDQLYQEQDDDGSGETTVEPVSTQPPSTEPPTPPPGVSAPDLGTHFNKRYRNPYSAEIFPYRSRGPKGLLSI